MCLKVVTEDLDFLSIAKKLKTDEDSRLKEYFKEKKDSYFRESLMTVYLDIQDDISELAEGEIKQYILFQFITRGKKENYSVSILDMEKIYLSSYIRLLSIAEYLISKQSFYIQNNLKKNYLVFVLKALSLHSEKMTPEGIASEMNRFYTAISSEELLEHTKEMSKESAVDINIAFSKAKEGVKRLKEQGSFDRIRTDSFLYFLKFNS